MGDDPKVSKERILDGAEAILDSGRYGDLTVDALARSLRMSKSTLYKYFPSKEDVVVALVRACCERAEAELAEALRDPDDAARLCRLATAFGELGQRLPRAVIVEADRLPTPCTTRLRQTREAFAAGAAEVVRSGTTSGEFRYPDAHTAALSFVAAAEAILLDSARRGVDSYGERADLLTQLFLPGLRA